MSELIEQQRRPFDAGWAETDSLINRLLGAIPAFMRKAKCRGLGHQDVNPFYAEYRDNQTVALAKSICRGTQFEGDYECPVRYQCLKWAVERPETAGVWGGVSERERRRIRRDIGLILDEPDDTEEDDEEFEPDESYHESLARYKENGITYIRRRQASPDTAVNGG